MAKTVMAFGSFDILHPGHLLYLRRARALGSRLIVVVARDESIMMFKKKKPVFNERDRLDMIKSLRIVDEAVLGNRLKGEAGRLRIIRKYKPNVIAFGYDQKIDPVAVEKWLRKNDLEVKVVRIKVSANPRQYKSSAISRRILRL